MVSRASPFPKTKGRYEKIDRSIEEYQIKKAQREKEGTLKGQSSEAFNEEIHWLCGVIYGLKVAKNL